MKHIESFDQTESYKETIEPELRKLAAKCYSLGIPFFAAVAIKEDGIKTEYKYQMVSPAVAAREISDDRISRFCNVVKGYEVVSPNDMISMDEITI